MIGRAAALLRRGSTSSHVDEASRTVQRICSTSAAAATATTSPLLASSSLSQRRTRLPHQRRFQSSYTPALHPSAPASAEVDTSTSSISSPAFHFEPFSQGQTQRSRTRLPTPLPPDLAERRKTEFKRRLREHREKLRRYARGKSQDAPEDHVSPASGDLSTLTLKAMNQNDAFFTPSHAIENLAILRACLRTGLVERAAKIFKGMRGEANDRAEELSQWAPKGSSVSEGSPRRFASPLGVSIYNTMLGAFLEKAWQGESSSSSNKEYISDAWRLLDAMTKGKEGGKSTSDPLPDEETFAIMAKGLVRLIRSDRLPKTTQNLTNFLTSLRQSGLRLPDVMLCSSFSREGGEAGEFEMNSTSREGGPDVKMVFQILAPVVAEMGDVILENDLEAVRRTLQGLDKQATQHTDETDHTSEVVEDVPELLPVTTYSKTDAKAKEKAGAEDEVNFNLKILRENLSIVEEAKESSADPYERQKWLEFGALEAARKRFEAGASHMEELGLTNDGSLKQKDLQRWMWSWYKKMTVSLKEDIDRIRKEDASSIPVSPHNSTRGVEAQILPFLRLLPVEKLAMLVTLEIMRMQGTSGVTDGMKTASAVMRIGRSVEREYHTQLLREDPGYLAKTRQAQNALWQGGITSMELRKQLKSTLGQDSTTVDEDVLGWSSNILARLGSYLIQHLMNVATVKQSAIDRDGVSWDEDLPAFYSAYQYIKGKRLGVIKLNEVVSKRLAKDSTIETLHPRHLPMLVPPKPWLTYDTGGYYSVKTKVLRYKDNMEQGSYLRAASEDGSLEYILAGLDVLGSTAWTVNKDVFRVVSDVWNSGKGIAEVPPLELAEEEPTKPDNYDVDIKSRGIYLNKMKLHNLRRLANHSQRCDVSYRLEIARAFMDERFFFPHNMDFRGRAYPLPPHLNHIGNDLSRGLLLFADAKPLGAVGLRWLRIHLANVYGFDKASLSEREQFAIEHEKDIHDSVSDPLGEGGWWLKAGDPWQCLATCMELVKARDHPEGPEKYPCRLPVHQDGTCNGLQHYAALGGDMAGAKQVNLSGGDRPSDVYTAVADLVIEVVERDAALGVEAAQLVQGKITRKVVKQTVMTTVYGVTFIGAKDQVARQLEDRGLATESIWVCSTYLAKQIMTCIGDLFSGAEAIQNWFRESARMIASSISPERIRDIEKDVKFNYTTALKKEQMTSVIWTTPLGLPVVQPYRKAVRKQIKTAIQSVFIHDPYLATQVSPGKQASAFPPNFIHSLDATHMLLTALECQIAKLTFASVHDSYWTHACDIETMSDIIRDTFVRLHSCDILQKLQAEFLDRYDGHVVPVRIAKDSLAKREKRALRMKKISQEDSGTILVEETENGHLRAKTDPVKFGENGIEGDEEEEGDGDEEGEGDERMEEAVAKKREAAATTARLNSQDKKFQNKFVLLKDILPPIPQKGAFDVNEIKRSLYFFS
ncbi:hypothetical protein CBS101457_003525 [Exobasidium rhododendri]|nr:hypothetical protein CBS101457_003525 [Exobasidium rhododendri]